MGMQVNGAAQIAQRNADAFEDINVQRFNLARAAWLAEVAARADAMARLSAALRYQR